ncbi:MAG: T9SS type A sorting domain-containing protein [Bacteroidetes bacterium]|nr:T9SS type A sorting domain-containing protein [Bacteroidota bacterium]
MKKILICLAFLVAVFSLKAQQCSKLNIKLQSSIASTCSQMTVTMLHDQRNKAYLYVANKEAGFKAYDITDLTKPVLVKSIAIDSMQKLDVMSLSQQGNYVYLALGNHFGTGQNPGMAIVDVTDPKKIVLRGTWKSPRKDGGAGVVRADSNYAYLGAMKQGLVIFDISDKDKIKQLSQLKPDINFPDKKGDSTKVNARGMEVIGDIVYLCYDAGGLRIINTKNKSNPKETGRYSNPVLNGKPRAYNNLVLDDTLLYITTDFCGLEVLNIKDTANIKQVAWWNPFGCETNALKWFTSPAHTNEIHLDKDCKLLFISTGKSDMYVLNVADPTKPDSCNYYGGTGNNIGTWGINVFKGKIFLSYICAVVPFSSNWTGVKILTYDDKCATALEKPLSLPIKIYPNPATDEVFIEGIKGETLDSKTAITITNILGGRLSPTLLQTSENRIRVDVKGWAAGVYFVSVISGEKRFFGRMIKN